jgi:hypothetical protein
MKTSLTPVIVGLLFVTVASPALAQSGGSSGSPFQESSAGRAMQRITFGAIDCADPPTCSTDLFTTSGLFVNGTYKDTRLNYGGPLTQGDVSNSLLLLILTQSQTFPNASSASGFTFSLKGSSVPVLESELYGPLFGERALTNGKGQLSFTVNFNRLRWRSIDGSDVRNDDEGLLWGDTNYDSNGGGYVGICRMDINTTVTFAAVNYGIHDQVDVSFAVPIVHTTVEGSNEYLDFQYLNGRFVPTSSGSLFTFDPQGRYFVKGSSTGIGDIAVGAKYAFVKREGGGAAVAIRSSFPTGSLEDMTGTGEFNTAFNFIGSFEKNGISPHVNIGYLAAGGDVFNEFNYSFGASFRVVPNRVTVGGEFVGRRVFDVTEFTGVNQIGSLTSPITGEVFPVFDFAAETRDVSLYFVAFGGKIRVTGQWLATLYAVLPAGDSGLQVTRPTFNFGVNYAF